MALTPVGIKLVVEGESGFTAAFLKATGAVTSMSTAAAKSTSVMDAFNKAIKTPEAALQKLQDRFDAQARQMKAYQTELDRLNNAYKAHAGTLTEYQQRQQLLSNQIDIYNRKLELELAELDRIRNKHGETGEAYERQKIKVDSLILSLDRSMTAYENVDRDIEQLSTTIDKSAEAVQRKENQIARLDATMQTTAGQILAMEDAMQQEGETVNQGARYAMVLSGAMNTVGNAMSTVGKAVTSVANFMSSLVNVFVRAGKAVADFVINAVKSFANFAVGVGNGAVTVAGKLNDIIASLLGLKTKTQETSDFWESAWGRMVEVMGGILIRDAIRGIINWMGELGSSLLTSLSGFQGLKIELEGLMAIEGQRGRVVEENETIYRAASAEQQAIYAGLTQKQVLLNQALADAKNKYNELAGAEGTSAAQLLAQQTVIDKYSTQLGTINKQLGAMWDGTEQVTQAMVPHKEGVLSASEAWAQASGKAQELIEWIKVMAVTTPFTVESLQKTLAMGMAMGFDSDQAKELTKSVGNFTAGMGLGEAQMERIVYAFGQIKSAGRLLGTEVRQLTESFVPVRTIFENIAEKSGMTWQQVRDGLRDGSIDLQLFFDEFNNLVNNNFANSAERMTRTWQGVTSNIQDFVQAVLGVEVLGPVFDRITGMMADALTSLMKPEVRAFFKNLGKTILQVFDAIVAALAPFVKAFANAFGTMLASIGTFGSVAGKILGVVFSGEIVDTLSRLTDLRTMITSVFGGEAANAVVDFAIDAQTAFTNVRNAIMRFIATVKGVLGTGGSWAKALTDATSGITGFNTSTGKAFTRIAFIVGWAVDFIRLSLEEIGPTLTVVGNIFAAVFNAIGIVLSTFGIALDNITKAITTDMPTTGDVVARVWTGIRNILQGVADFINTEVTPRLIGIRTTVEENWPAIQAKALEVWSTVKGYWDTYIGGIWNWLKENWQQIASMLLGAFASTELLAGLAMVGKLVAALVNPFSLVITAAGLLATAWTTNWGNIQGAMPTIVENLKGILGSLVDFINQTVMPAITGIGASTGGEMPENRRMGGAVLGDIGPETGGTNGFMQGLTQGIIAFRKWVDTDLIPTMTRVVGWVESNWPKIAKAIGDVFTGISKAWEGGGKQVFEWLLNNIPLVTTAFIGLQIAGPILTGFGGTLVFLSQTINGIAWAVGILTNAGLGLGAAIGTVVGVVGGIALAIVGVAAAIAAYITNFNGFRDSVDGTVGQIKNALQGAIDFILSIPQKIGDFFAFMVQDPAKVTKQIYDFAHNIGKTLRDAISGALIAAWGWISQTAWPAVAKFFTDLYNNIKTWIEGGGLIQLGQAIIQGIAQGITSAVYFIFNALSAVVGMIIGFITGLLGIASPSTVMAEQVGAPMMEGLAAGIEGAIGFVVGIVQGVVDAIIAVFQFLWPGIQVVVQALQVVLAAAFQAVAWVVTNIIIPAFTAVYNWLAVNLPIAFAVAKSVWEGVLLPVFTGIFNWIKTNIVPAIQLVVQWLQTNIPIAFKAVSDFWTGTLQPALNDLWTWVKDNIIPIVMEAYNWFNDNLPLAWAVVVSVWNGVLKPALTDAWNYFKQNILPIVAEAVLAFGTTLKNAWDAVVNFWNQTLHPALIDLWNYISVNILPVVADAVLAFGTTLKNAFDAVVAFVRDTLIPKLVDLWTKLGEVKDIVANALTTAFDTFRTGVLDPLKAGFDSVYGAVRDVYQKFKDFWDWVSTLDLSKIAAFLGGSPSPLAIGLDTAATAAGDLARKMAPIADMINNDMDAEKVLNVTDAFSRGRNMMATLADGIVSGGAQAISAATTVAESIDQAFGKTTMPSFANGTSAGTPQLGSPNNGKVRGTGAFDQVLAIAKESLSIYNDRFNSSYQWLREAGISQEQYLRDSVIPWAKKLGLDPKETVSKIFDILFGSTPTTEPSPSITGTPDPFVTEPGIGGTGTGTTGTGTDPYYDFASSVTKFSEAVTAFVSGLGGGAYLGGMGTTGGTKPNLYLGPPVPVAPPATATQMAARNNSRVVNNHYSFNVSASYADKQSPARISDDISLMLQMAQV